MNMNAVIEVDEVGHIIHTGPVDWPILPKTGAQRLQHGTLRPHLPMAVHADFRRRHSCEWTALDGCVAIPAVQPETADVMLMTERQRLLQYHKLVGDVRGADDSSPSRQKRRSRKDHTKYRQP